MNEAGVPSVGFETEVDKGETQGADQRAEEKENAQNAEEALSKDEKIRLEGLNLLRSDVEHVRRFKG